MKKVYEANGEEKEEIIDINNDYNAFDKARIGDVSIKDLVLITRVQNLSNDNKIESKFSINAIESSQNSENEILIFEPLKNQLRSGLQEISSNNTVFKAGITLSNEAIFLFPREKYVKLASKLEERKKLKNLKIRLYEGKEELAVKMLMQDNGYIFLKLDKNGYEIDKKNHPDIIAFTKKVLKIEAELNRKISKEQTQNDANLNVSSEKNNLKSNIQNLEIDENNNIINIVKLGKINENQCTENQYEKTEKYDTEEVKEEEKIDESKISTENENQSKEQNFQMITGLTKEKEGEINLGENFQASTDIGKRRKNQEDAVLLIKDSQNPHFKMMVVADGMGGEEKGEVASNTIVFELKNWFEKLSEEKKKSYFDSISNIEKDLLNEIEQKVQPLVESATWQLGGSTLVCAIIGKEETLIANVGDSRAYIVNGKELTQISREDTVAEEHLEKGIVPTKEAARFDEESNILLQSIGMNRNQLKCPHTKIIKNTDYDLLLLLTDGVTDCLSDDDILAICKTTDRAKLAQKIVEKAIRHDSIIPEKYEEYNGLHQYIPGGKDNTTAGVYLQTQKEEER